MGDTVHDPLGPQPGEPAAQPLPGGPPEPLTPIIPDPASEPVPLEPPTPEPA